MLLVFWAKGGLSVWGSGFALTECAHASVHALELWVIWCADVHCPGAIHPGHFQQCVPDATLCSVPGTVSSCGKDTR
jgi:hypothetical protein